MARNSACGPTSGQYVEVRHRLTYCRALGNLVRREQRRCPGVNGAIDFEHRAATTSRLDDPAVLEVVTAQPDLLTTAARPTFIDEWQRHPTSWDVVRRAVDDDHSPGRLIVTGSATPTKASAHSRASRIIPIRTRPLTMYERELESPTVSLVALLGGSRPALGDTTDVTLEDYTNEILTGGFPGMRYNSSRSQRAALDWYIDRVIDTDLPEIGVQVRNPHTLRRWLRAYAAASATSNPFEKIRGWRPRATSPLRRRRLRFPTERPSRKCGFSTRCPRGLPSIT